MTDLSEPIAESYWVHEQLVAGPYPGRRSDRDLASQLRCLLQAGVSFWLDLTESGEKDLESYEAVLRHEARSEGRQVAYRRMPIHDFDIPAVTQMRQVLDVLDTAIAGGHIVYVHCYAGIGRTGTVVGCFLVRHGYSGRAALDRIMALRRNVDPKAQPSPITAEQRGMVLNWTEVDEVGQ
jgi:protein-tyrosine phosphatase